MLNTNKMEPSKKQKKNLQRKVQKTIIEMDQHSYLGIKGYKNER